MLVLLAINWLSVLLSESGSQPRVQVPFSPYFLNQVQAGGVQSFTSQGDTINGTFKHKVRYPASDKTAVATTLFSTEVPRSGTPRSCRRCCAVRASPSMPSRPPRAPRCWRRSCSASARRCCWLGCSCCSRVVPEAGAGGLGGMGNFGRSQARRVDPSQIRVTFDDVAGIDEAKGELTEIVEFLRTPIASRCSAAGCPRGAPVRRARDR